MDGTTDTELRSYSLTELAILLSTFRQAQGWSQETLAELAGVTARTVQRVEAAKPSSLDTRRALARAFALDDIDAFSRPKEFLTPEGAARAKEDFDRRFIILEVEPADGRAVVMALAGSGPYQAISTGSVGQSPPAVQDVFAKILDYLGDVIDIGDDVGHAEMLGYGDEIETMIKEMRVEGWEVAYGSRRVRISQARLPAVLTHVLAVPVGGGKRHVAVPKAI